MSTVLSSSCQPRSDLNWQRELERWAPELVTRRLMGSQADRIAYYELPIAVLIATYEQVSAGRTGSDTCRRL